jgi:tetratricopeptide (TPR) repeat protein
MAIDNGLAQRRLREGSEALKAGNRVRARDLLLEAVERDRDLEPAWWALYQAVDEPREQIRALENVLRLNPHHAEAQQALTGMRTRRLAEQRPGQPDWASLLPVVPLETDDGVDDPYQCPACGRATGVDDRRCPHCRTGLFARMARAASPGALRLVFLLLGISLAAGLLELAAPLFALGAAQSPGDRLTFEGLLAVFGVQAFLGRYVDLPPATAWLLLQILLVRAGLLVAILLGLRERWALAFYAALLGLLADMLVGVYVLITGYLGVGAALFNLVLALVTALILIGLSGEFAVNYERILVKPDGKARSAQDFYRRGHAYRQRGLWAMAVAQWRKATGLAPQVATYYKHLGLGYAQIKRFGRSLRALEEAQRQDPGDPQIAEIIRLVQAKAETNSLLRR